MQRMHSWAQRRDMIDRGRPNRFGEGGRPDGGPGEKGGEPSANRQARGKGGLSKSDKFPERHFKRMDVNGDELILLSEFSSVHPGREKDFEQLCLK